MNNYIVIGASVLYLCLLFGVAYFAEYRLKKGKSLIANPYVYALSLAVFCTAWTFYGSVGRAAEFGIEYITTYLGATLMCVMFIPVLRKIVRICKTQRIISIADFISTRYGKNFSIAVVVTILCVLGIIPYVALQVKAISTSMDVLTGADTSALGLQEFYKDKAFYITVLLTFFIILFGTRSIDASEKHEGLVAAIAFESIIKLIAFLAVGFFVTYQLYDGFSDVFTKASANPSFQELFLLEGNVSYSSWITLVMLSMMAFIFLPRQFQVGVVENMQERHLQKASWLFPLYLLLINVFVLPIMFGGKMLLNETNFEPDSYVLALPLQAGHDMLGLFVFIGGFSAATSMIIAETIALSIMMSNNISTPLLLKVRDFNAGNDTSISRRILYSRRISIIIVLLLAYIYDKTVAQSASLVSIGLVSFAAVAQFAPAIFGGIYWKGGTQKAAITGMIIGFVIWTYTLVVPSWVVSGFLPEAIVTQGPFGIDWLRPESLFGMKGMDPISHSLFWSLMCNIAAYVMISFNTKQTSQEIYQSEIFVDIFKHSTVEGSESVWRGTAYLPDLTSLLATFLGKERADNLIKKFASRNKINLLQSRADPRLVSFAEKVLSGIIGSASARIMVSSVTKEEDLKIEEVVKILRESQQIIELNKELTRKSQELTRASEQLKIANAALTEIDVLKDEFLYTVTHELRTPLTSIRAMAEIIHDNPDMEDEERNHFLSGVIKESERLSHLITQVLSLERYESGRQKLHLEPVDMRLMVNDVIQSFQAIAAERNIKIVKQLPDSMLLLQCDKALIHQVLVNLVANAVKFVKDGEGLVKISMFENYNEWQVWVEDNGKGIDPDLHELIFDKFFQARNQTLKKPEGSGLGLSICKKIVEMHGGKIWVENVQGNGARFIFTIPV